MNVTLRNYFFVGLLSLFLLLSTNTFAQSENHTVQSGNVSRSYILYKPFDLTGRSNVPLVVMLHGGLGTGMQAERSYHWEEQASTSGFIVAFPNGLSNTWNAGGGCCGGAARDNVDDVAFITDMINDIGRTTSIDTKRIYLTGMSNGSAMAYRYACEGSYPIAAIGPVSGSLSTACRNPRPISVMEIHGGADQNIPISGGYGTKGMAHVAWLGVPQTLAIFQKADQCSAPVDKQKGPVRISTSNCANNNQVVLITIDGAGHQWPGSVPRRFSMIFTPDPPSEALSATSTLWDFFSKHTAP